MKRLLTFLTLLTLFFTTSWAAEATDTWNATQGAFGGSGSGQAGTFTTAGGKTWNYERSRTVYAAFTSQCIQLGSGSGAENLTLYTSGYGTAIIKSVSVECSSYKGYHNVSITVGEETYLASTATDAWTTIGTKTGTGNSSGEIEIKFTAGNSARALYIKSITITYEEGGTPATTYAITCNGDDHGSISAAPNPAAENATVTITPVPETGYQLSTLTAYKTGDTNTPVSISNNQFTMPGYPVTVDATFEVIPTYSITVNGGGSASPNPAHEGQTVTVSLPDGKMIDTYTSTPEVTLAQDGDNYTFTMPNQAVILNLTLKDKPVQSGRFERITDVSKLEKDARYLIVYEGDDTHDPAVLGAISTTSTKYGISVPATDDNDKVNYTYANGVITLNSESAAKPLTLGGSSGAWTFELDGALLNHTGDGNTLTTGTQNTTWTISFDGTGTNKKAIITNCRTDYTRVMRYNNASNQLRFACYKGSTINNMQDIYLYKEVGTIVESSDLYIVGQVNGNDEDPFDPEEGVQLTYSQTNGTYSGDFYCKGMNGGYSYLLFSKSIPADFDNDKSNLYGAGGNGNAWVINESDYGNAIPLYATSSDSFRLPAGLYSVSIALSGAGFEWTDASVTFTTREKTMVINGSQYFEDTREVTMTSNLTDIGGKIYYTTDGGNPSDPNSSRQEYTGPITISETTTFKAVAFVGNLYSAVVEKTFTKTPKTPVINPNGGTITEATQVTITCETEGASIYYTLDGSTPTNVVSETNFLYSEPFTIDETTTVKARAYVGNTYSNGIATAEFVYTEPYVPGEGDFVLVDSEDDLKAGREYIIVTADYHWAMGAVDSKKDKATASQDFEITIDHSTVTLTENSTVNVMKLVDGIEDTNNKYWNLHQANGLNIYLENPGTGIKEQVHGFGLSGYSDEVLINLTTTTNYAIITPGGRQILYQNGSNGAAGVFGHYANSNADATGYQRIFLYYREGATVPPTGVTLAELCATGVKDKDYIIADKLQAVYAYTKGGNSLLWCKDLGNQSIYPTTIHSGQIDFMRNTAINWDEEHQVHNGQQGEWDQSNWIVLQFTNPTGPNNIDQMLQNAQDKFIKPGTIKGKLVDDENYILKMDLDMIETLTPADEGYDEEPYNENVYCPANFLPDNLNIHGGIENGDGAETSTQNYFFMNPKVQEVCYITYAQWNEAYSCFTVPSTSGIPGAFQVGWVYQDKPGLENGHIYKFHAVVHRVGKQGYGPNNPITTKDDEMPPIYENITVLPVDLDPATSEIITSINTVETGNGEVKSVKYVNVAGMVSDVPFQGVNIVVTEYTDGSRTTSKMLKK